MELLDLTHDELLVLVGLARLVVHADHTVTAHESAALAALADEVGRDVWNARVAEARVRLPTAEATWDLAREVERSDAASVILETLRALAGADAISEEEQAILDYLAAIWPDADDTLVPPGGQDDEAFVLEGED